MMVWLVWEHRMHEDSTLLAVFSNYNDASDFACQYEDDDEYRIWYRVEMMEVDKEKVKAND